MPGMTKEAEITMDIVALSMFICQRNSSFRCILAEETFCKKIVANGAANSYGITLELSGGLF